MKALALALAVALLVAGCGKKGGLERPADWDAKPLPGGTRPNQGM